MRTSWAEVGDGERDAARDALVSVSGGCPWGKKKPTGALMCCMFCGHSVGVVRDDEEEGGEDVGGGGDWVTQTVVPFQNRPSIVFPRHRQHSHSHKGREKKIRAYNVSSPIEVAQVHAWSYRH